MDDDDGLMGKRESWTVLCRLHLLSTVVRHVHFELTIVYSVECSLSI